MADPMDDPLSQWLYGQQQPATMPPTLMAGMQGQPGAAAQQPTFGGGASGGASAGGSWSPSGPGPMGTGSYQFQPMGPQSTRALPQIPPNLEAYQTGGQRKQQLAANFIGGIWNSIQNQKTQNEGKQYQQAYNMWQQLMQAQKSVQDAQARGTTDPNAEAIIKYITTDPKSRKMIEESLGVMLPGGDSSKQTPTTQGAQRAVGDFIHKLGQQFDPRTQAQKLPAGAGIPAPGSAGTQGQAPIGMPMPQPQGQPPTGQPGVAGVPPGQTSGRPMSEVAGLPQGVGPFAPGGGGTPGMGGGIKPPQMPQTQPTSQQPNILQGRPGQVLNAPTMPARPPNPSSAPSATGAPQVASSNIDPRSRMTIESYFMPPPPDPRQVALNKAMQEEMSKPENVQKLARINLGLDPSADRQAMLDAEKERSKATQLHWQEMADAAKKRLDEQEEKIVDARKQGFVKALQAETAENSKRIKLGQKPANFVTPGLFGLTPEQVADIPGFGPSATPKGGPPVAGPPSVGVPKTTPTTPTTAPSVSPKPISPTTAARPTGGAPAAATTAAAAPSGRTVTEPGVGTYTVAGAGAGDAELIRKAPPAPPGWQATVVTSGTGKNKQSKVEYVPGPNTPQYQFLHRNELKPIPGTNLSYGVLPADHFDALSVEAASRYYLDPTKMASAFSGQRKLMTEQTLNYKPNWDQSQYTTRYQARKSFAPGGVDNKINGSLDTVVGHTSSMLARFLEFGNTSSPEANRAAHFMKERTSAGFEDAWKLDSSAVSTELATALKGVATDSEIATIKATLSNPYADPDNYKKTVNQLIDLADKRYRTQDNKFLQAMREDRDFSIMSADSIASLNKLGRSDTAMSKDIGRPSVEKMEMLSNPNAKTRYNKKTGEVAISTDGGKTWQLTTPSRVQ